MPRVLAEISLTGHPNLVDISDRNAFDTVTARFKIHLSFDEARASDPFGPSEIAERTRRLGEGVAASGAAGLITRSARFDGRCVVVFPDNLDSSLVQIDAKEDIVLDPSEGGVPWTGASPMDISTDEVIVLRGGTSHPIQVLHFGSS